MLTEGKAFLVTCMFNWLCSMWHKSVMPRSAWQNQSCVLTIKTSCRLYTGIFNITIVKQTIMTAIVLSTTYLTYIHNQLDFVKGHLYKSYISIFSKFHHKIPCLSQVIKPFVCFSYVQWPWYWPPLTQLSISLIVRGPFLVAALSVRPSVCMSACPSALFLSWK